MNWMAIFTVRTSSSASYIMLELMQDILHHTSGHLALYVPGLKVLRVSLNF